MIKICDIPFSSTHIALAYKTLPKAGWSNFYRYLTAYCGSRYTSHMLRTELTVTFTFGLLHQISYMFHDISFIDTVGKATEDNQDIKY